MMGVKAWLRKWLEVPTAPPAPARKGGFFDDATPISSAMFTADRTWNNVLDKAQSWAIQRTHPTEFAAVKYATDSVTGEPTGRVTVAMDDIGYDTTGKFNLTSGVGDLPALQMEWFARHSFIGHQLCAILAQHWFINKACFMPARDAIRNGYDISVPAPVGEKDNKDDPRRTAIVDEQHKLDKRFKVKKNCIQAVRMMRVFGIRIVLFKVNSPDPDYYVKPFNADGVTAGSYKGMTQVDPYWISPELDYEAASDPASMHFFEPTFWRINGQRYHRSHLVVITGPEVADVLKPTYLYGGLSIPQLVFERVYASERVADEAPALAMTKRLTSVEGVDMLAAMGNPASFLKKVAAFTQMRDSYGVHFLGMGESVKQLDTALTDFDTLIMTQFQLACGTVNVPSTKMMGTQPKGFNATGESEAANYREELESIQEHDMTPIIERHHLLCMRSFIMPKFQLAEPVEYAIEWNELDPETSKEKSEREKQDADRDKALSDTGAIDSIDIRNRLRKDKTSSYHGIEEAIPEGPRPATVVDPGAEKTAPNAPTPAEQTAPAAPGAAPAAPGQ